MTGFPRRTGGESFLWPHKNNHARLLADAETGPPLLPPLLASRLLAGAWPPRPLTGWRAPRQAEGAGTGQGMRGGGRRWGSPPKSSQAEEKGGGRVAGREVGRSFQGARVLGGGGGVQLLRNRAFIPSVWDFSKTSFYTYSFLLGSCPPPNHSLGHSPTSTWWGTE